MTPHETLRVPPNSRKVLSLVDPADTLGADGEADAMARIKAAAEQLAELQFRLEAESERALLVVLQGMDAAGKDETIRSALRGLNPQAYRVESFKAPAGNEEAHDFLWRFHEQCPAHGEIGVWNRSHYEEVIGARVRGDVAASRWRRRYRHIVAFEEMLADEGTTVVKFYMHISHAEQGRRLQERLDDPRHRWEFSESDIEDRRRWDDYMDAFEDALRATTTERAPWYLVPADHEWARDLAVLEILVATLEAMDPQIPQPDHDIERID